MARDYDAIYLSPHLDDAILSCGGHIHRRTRAGERVLIVTLFAGDEPATPPSELARRLHGLFGLESRVVEARRREDAAACQLLRAQADRWPLEEAIYRLDSETGKALYADMESLFGDPRSADGKPLSRLGSRLRELPPHRRIFAPLGVGGHVDHRLARRAAEQAGGGRLLYYEDYPYVARRRALTAALATPSAWTPTVVELEPRDLEAKIDAAAACGSQLRALFGSRRRLERRLRRYARRVGGERIWQENEGRLG